MLCSIISHCRNGKNFEKKAEGICIIAIFNFLHFAARLFFFASSPIKSFFIANNFLLCIPAFVLQISSLQEKFFCPVCSAIQPVEEGNYFDYLGVVPGFDVDLSLLKRNFRKLQSQVHPDKFLRCSQVKFQICLIYSCVLCSALKDFNALQHVEWERWRVNRGVCICFRRAKVGYACSFYIA